MNATNITSQHYSKIHAALPFRLEKTHLSVGERSEGKVRDFYSLGDKVILITTDRLTAFDRHLALIPFKGQVLNLISAWWFAKTAAIVPNHVLALPDPNVVIAKKCTVFPIEFVVRGYITGSTNTSLWTQYVAGAREYCGQSFPDGLKKNQKLQEPVLTPTTKEAIHDRPISPEEIIAEGWMSEEDWIKASELAIVLYQKGVEIAKQQGLILVDTKYEFGRDADGNILIVDEIHTPDSSRYWLADSYENQIEEGLEPESIDKEFLRLWFAKNCDPYGKTTLPEAPVELIEELSARYIKLYELITGETFNFPANNESIEQRIERNIAHYLTYNSHN